MEGNRVARVGSAVAAVVAALALLGWLTRIHRLTQLVPGEGAMRPEAAIASLAAAASVYLGARRRTRGAVALAALPFLIGLEALVAQGVGRLYAIHDRLPSLPHAITGAVMPVPTAAAFVLVGVALAIARARPRVLERTFDGCIGLVLLIGTLSFLGRTYHVLSAGAVNAVWAIETTSLPTAVALLSLGVAIASLRPDRGMAAAMLDRGPAGVLLRHVLPAAIVVPTLFGWLHDWAEKQTGVLAAIGLAAYVIANIAVLVAVVAYAAREVRRLDADRTEAHRTLVASEEVYRRTFFDVPVGCGTLDQDLELRSANPALCRLLGYEPDELVGVPLREITLPGEREDEIHTAAKLFSGELDGYAVERRFRTKAGRVVEVMLHASAVRDDQGRVLFAVGVLEDLTERKRIEATLVESEARYRLMAESSPQIVWVAGRDGAVEYVSPEWSRYAGCHERIGAGAWWRERIHPDDVERRTSAWEKAVEEGTPYELEYRLRRYDGAYRWFLSRAVPIRGNGTIAKWYGADTDVHDLREAQEALRLGEQRFRVALLGSPVVVWTQDKALRYTWVHNPSPGFEPERALGTTDRELFERPEDGELLTSLKQRVLDTGERLNASIRVVIDGEPREFDLWLEPLKDARGDVEGITGSAYDVSERVRLEERLRHAQKLESLGALAGGLAHGFNNLLTVVIGNAVTLRGSLAADARARVSNTVEEIIKAGEDAAALTKQLLAYSGKGRFFVEPVDLGELVASLAPPLRSTVSPHVRLAVEAAPCGGRVEADVAEIKQLVTNLVVNAGEAIGDAPGTITIRVGLRALERGSAEASRAGLPAGCYFALEVRDDGPGMDEATLQRIFDPFFSTKVFGRGLGLPAAQGIARAHRGAIYATSERGRGSVFHVFLPAVATAAEAPVAEEPPTGTRRIPATGGVVLFVDDEPPLRNLAEAVLRDAGYEVLLAEHGEAALEIAARHIDAIDVVVLDMSMPVLGGAETAERLRALCPDLPIIASSGYSEAELRAKFASTRPEFLRKPYRPSELVSKVRAALAIRRTHAELQAR